MASADDLIATHESLGRSHLGGDYTGEQTAEEQSVTDTEMEDNIKQSGLDHKSKKLLY